MQQQKLHRLPLILTYPECLNIQPLQNNRYHSPLFTGSILCQRRKSVHKYYNITVTDNGNG
jgi:hypothetical protein